MVFQTKADATYAEMRRLILQGRFPGNAVLNQEQLAVTLGVSTTPLREALRRLEAETLVEFCGKGQVMVTEVDPAKLPDLYVVREQLDCLAGRLAAEAATLDDIKALKAALLVQPPAGATHLDYWAANVEFHRTIHVASHNAVLRDTVDRIYLQYDRYNAVFVRYVLDDIAQREHEAMVVAIEARRADDVEALMRAHYEHGRRFLPAISSSENKGAPTPDGERSDSVSEPDKPARWLRTPRSAEFQRR